MGREQLINQNIANAKDADLRASFAAIKRAAELARKTALQTGTGIVVVEGGKMVYISAADLRTEQMSA